MLSNIEIEFAKKNIASRHRLDKRDLIKHRPIKFTFESERGCCILDFGLTKVMAQVSWDLTAPKDSRPNDGILKCNVELSMLAHPRFEMSNTRHLTSAHLSRLLEKCICESRCLDLESLCLEAGIRVMQIRVDVHALNDDGNLIGAMCLAAVTALCHFRRPDVSYDGGKASILSFSEKDPLSLTMLHIPVCSHFALVQGNLLLDPTLIEQRISEALVIVACNKFREVCVLQVAGQKIPHPSQILDCVKIATVEADEISEILRKALDHDSKERHLGKPTSTYPNSQPVDKINIKKENDNDEDDDDDDAANDDMIQPAMTINKMILDDDNEDDDDDDEEIEKSLNGTSEKDDDVAIANKPQFKFIQDNVVEIGLGGNSNWNITDNQEKRLNTKNSSDINSSSSKLTKDLTSLETDFKTKNKSKRKKVSNKNESSSEEEETLTLLSNDQCVETIDLSIALNKSTKAKSNVKK